MATRYLLLFKSLFIKLQVINYYSIFLLLLIAARVFFLKFTDVDKYEIKEEQVYEYISSQCIF